MTDEFKKARDEAASDYAIYKTSRDYRCPACNEETIWPVVHGDFEAGADWGAFESPVVTALVERMKALCADGYACQQDKQALATFERAKREAGK